MPTKILITSASARTSSFNRRLAAQATRLARQAGAEVTELDLGALALPLYNGDVEAAAMPAGALELRRLFASHQGFIVAAAEYNSFPTPLLINALDWASRPAADGELPSGIGALNGTVAGIVSASPGALGGLRVQISLRAYLATGLGMLVVPETASVGQAHQAFDEAGALKDAKHQQALARVVQAVLKQAAMR
jgi:chromate reductase, NAD(P)H dehydrogenase (quinone)